jgi:GNAT superfamily N-acetyltransferase
MKSRKIPMTVEEFELADFPFGWKDEYCDGFAYFSPREHGVLMKMPVEKREVAGDFEILPVSEAGGDDLVELFYGSFVDSVEFCDLSKSQIKKEAKKNVGKFFDGKRGEPRLELCRIAKSEDRLIGACLISKYKYGYKNEILFVRPGQQRKGLGSALVADVLGALHSKGEKIFWSEHHICNELSANWHRKFGFTEETDILTARLRRNYLIHQINRHERLGNPQQAAPLKPLLEKAQSEVTRLEKIQEEDFDAAWLRWKNDY